MTSKLKFNHESDDMLVAMGITEDQYDEIIFKIEQIQKRKSRRSEVIEAAIEWVNQKFCDDDRLKSLAMLIIGKQIERSSLMESIHEVASKIGPGILERLKSQSLTSTQAPDNSFIFDDQDKMSDFMSDVKLLVKEYNGEEVDLGKDGIMAIKLNASDHAAFRNKLDKLKKKYDIQGGDEIGMTMPISLGGPIGEA